MFQHISSSACTTFIFYMFTQINFQTPLSIRFHCLISNIQNRHKIISQQQKKSFLEDLLLIVLPIPSEELSESDDDLIYMSMDTSDSADIDATNDVIIIDEEDKQKPAQQKQEASKKSEEQAATPVHEQGERKPPQAVQHKERPALSQR